MDKIKVFISEENKKSLNYLDKIEEEFKKARLRQSAKALSRILNEKAKKSRYNLNEILEEVRR